MALTWKLRRLLSSAYTDLLLWVVWVLVVSLALVLPVYLGASFLLLRNCQPHLNVSLGNDFFAGIDISNIVDNFGSQPSSANVSEPAESALESFLLSYQSTELTLVSGDQNVNVTAPVLPRHLLKSGLELVTAFIAKYNINDVSSYCSVNSVREAPGLLSLAVGVCRSALRSAVGQQEEEQLSAWLAGLQPGTESGLIAGVTSGNISSALSHLPQLFPSAGLDDEHVSSLQALVAPFEISELVTLLTAFRNANFTDADLAVLEEISMTAVDDLKAAEKVLMKIKVENLPAIVAKLDELEIELTDFITNPGIFFDFLGDEVKSAILVDLQTLLPKFKPSDIETFLVLQENVEAAQQKYGDPDEPSVMSKLFKIPMDVLLSALPKIKLDDSAAAAFDTFKLLMEDDDFEFLSSVMSGLLETRVQKQVIEDCTKQDFTIVCRDTENDVCPTGHLVLGVASLAPLLLPGLMYALTTFLHYQGDIMQCGLGKPFNIPTSKLDRISAWIILLPLYMLFMIPWTLCLIVYRQFVVCVHLLKEIQGGSKVEADCEAINNASSFGLLFGAGQGVLHLGIQIIVVGLLLGVGDTVLGLESQFVHDNAIVCVISALLGLVVLVVSHLSSQECGRLGRDLSTPRHSLTYLSTSLCWLLTSTAISVLSTLLLCSLLYVDTVSLARPSWLILPVVVLGLSPLLQSVIYHLLVKEGCEHRFAWGMFAAVTPVRFLETESRKTAVFLLWSQAAWLATHTAAWLVYCVYSIVTDQADTVFRVWLPVIMPLLLVPPLTACLHWAVSLSPLYTSRHCHPDMSREEKRSLSFPPDWAQLAGTSVPPDSLARAGFFYSCRRLNSSEATCFACGRQVTDWTNIKTSEMARMCSEHCPLYTESKQTPPAATNMDNNNVSCFAEFLFIASTLLFRIASICLLLWAFMDQWKSAGLSLATLVIIPPLYVFVLVLFNMTTYFICLGNTSSSSPVWAMVSVLLPRPVKCSLSSARQLLVLNVSSNLLLHAFLWAALTGACSSCSISVSVSRLSAAWPVLLVLGLLSVLLTFPYYFLTVRLQPRHGPQHAGRDNNGFMVSTAL